MNVSPKVVDEFMEADNKKQEVMTLRFLLANLLTQIDQNTIVRGGEPKGCANSSLHYFLCRGYEYIEDKLDYIELQGKVSETIKKHKEENA